MRGLGGRLDEDKDDDGYIHDDVAKAFLGDIVSYKAGLIPVVGVPLPLISQGGTSIVVHLLAFGVILSTKRVQT